MIWLDAHLSPRIANWIADAFHIECEPLRSLGLREAQDSEIFEAARNENIIVITKDRDFVELVLRNGSPPKIIWLRCGNTSEHKLKEILNKHLIETLHLLDSEDLVEIQQD